MNDAVNLAEACLLSGTAWRSSIFPLQRLCQTPVADTFNDALLTFNE